MTRLINTIRLNIRFLRSHFFNVSVTQKDFHRNNLFGRAFSQATRFAARVKQPRLNPRAEEPPRGEVTPGGGIRNEETNEWRKG